jgi:hypothetical protein
VTAPLLIFQPGVWGSPRGFPVGKPSNTVTLGESLVLTLAVPWKRAARMEGAVGRPGEPTHQFRPRDDEPPSPELAKQRLLEHENAELRTEVKHLRSALRCAARTLRPYAGTTR